VKIGVHIYSIIHIDYIRSNVICKQIITNMVTMRISEVI
jgi:hypothetical protein